MVLNPRAEKRFNFDYYLNQAVRTDSNIKAKSFEASRYIGLDEEIGSHHFNANFYSGGGWKLWQNQHKKYNLMIDNLWVRGTTTFYELVINQLRASNGTVIISSCGKTKEDGAELDASTSYHLWFDSGDNTSVDMQPFAVNDIIMAKKFDMPNDGDSTTAVLEVYGTVTAISVGGEHNKITFDTAGSPSTPLDKGVLEFVRIGNTSDASRQGSIVLTSDGIDSDLGGGGTGTVPYIDVYAGVDTRAKFMDKDYVTVRLGRLDEITGGVDEFGLYGNVVHLTGGGSTGFGKTMEGSGVPYSGSTPASENPANLPNGTLYWDYTNQIFYLVVSNSWTVMAGGIGENGDLGIPPSPSGSGLYASGTHLGFYADSDWRGYWLNDGTDAGDFYLKGASNTCLWWDYSAASLYIGGDSVGSAHIKAVAATAQLQFFDSNNPAVNCMNLGSNLIGSHGGIQLLDKGVLYMSTTNADGISNIHLEKYNQSHSGVQGLQTLYLSNDNSASVTENPTNAWVVSKIEGERSSSNDIYGIYGNVSNAGSGDAYGIKLETVFSSSGNAYGVDVAPFGTANTYGFRAIVGGTAGNKWGVYGSTSGAGTVNYGIYGIALGATTNWAGYFADGNVNINNTLFFGSGADTNLYRHAADVLKTDDDFRCQSFEATGGYFTGEVSLDTQLRLKELGSAPAHAAGYGKLWAQQSDHGSLYTQPMWTTDAGHDDYVATVALKTTTGHPSGWTGRMEINTFDNLIAMYAEGSWRQLASW